MAAAPASGAAAASTGPGPSAPSPVSGHAALPPVSDVLAELMQFPDETLWPALCDLGPEDLMRMHDLLGSAFADRMGLTPLRFQNPPPDVDMEDKTRPEVPPAAPDTNLLHVGVKQPNMKSGLSSNKRHYELKLGWPKYIHYSI